MDKEKLFKTVLENIKADPYKRIYTSFDSGIEYNLFISELCRRGFLNKTKTGQYEISFIGEEIIEINPEINYQELKKKLMEENKFNVTNNITNSNIGGSNNNVNAKNTNVGNNNDFKIKKGEPWYVKLIQFFKSLFI